VTRRSAATSEATAGSETIQASRCPPFAPTRGTPMSLATAIVLVLIVLVIVALVR
jgi:hypothetical protein